MNIGIPDFRKVAHIRLRNLDHFHAFGQKSSDPAQNDIRDLLLVIDQLLTLALKPESKP